MRLRWRGTYQLIHRIDGEVVDRVVSRNGVTKWGASRLCKDFLSFSAVQEPWHFGLIKGPAGSVTLDRDDQTGHNGENFGTPLDGHPGWDEFDYLTGDTRVGASFSTPSQGIRRAVSDADIKLGEGGTVSGVFISFQEDSDPNEFTFLEGDIFSTTKCADIAVTASSEIEVVYDLELIYC